MRRAEFPHCRFDTPYGGEDWEPFKVFVLRVLVMRNLSFGDRIVRSARMACAGNRMHLEELRSNITPLGRVIISALYSDAELTRRLEDVFDATEGLRLDRWRASMIARKVRSL